MAASQAAKAASIGLRLTLWGGEQAINAVYVGVLVVSMPITARRQQLAEEAEERFTRTAAPMLPGRTIRQERNARSYSH